MFNNTFWARLDSSGSFSRGGICYWLSLHLKDNISVLLIGRLTAARFYRPYFDDEYEGTLSPAGASLSKRPRTYRCCVAFLCQGPHPPKVVMLFFTQCFGAVLDLIHLRFQHYKAKRVFSAAGQLVCVVNPTHNLKVSCSVRVWAPRAGGRACPPRARARARSAREGRAAGAGTARVPGGAASAAARGLGGSALAGTARCLPGPQQLE